MASLYSNENFPKRVVEELRRLGHDVLTSYEAGRANQKIPDEQVLAYATEQTGALTRLGREQTLEELADKPRRSSARPETVMSCDAGLAGGHRPPGLPTAPTSPHQGPQTMETGALSAKGGIRRR